MIDLQNEESCLQVAARWNCLRIVQLLLERVEYEKSEIEETLKYQCVPQIIIKTLLNYYQRFRKNEPAVLCFC